MFTYLFDGFLRRVFSLLRDDGIVYIHNTLAWRHRSFLSKIISDFFTWSLGIRSRVLSRRPHLQNIFFTPISSDERKGLFPLWDSSQSFSFYLLLCQAIATDYYMSSISLLYPSGHRVKTSVAFHSDPQSLLSPTGRSKLTYITIPLLAVILWRPAKTRRDSRNSLFLSFQW